MAISKASFLKNSIARRLMLWFLAISLVPCTVLAVITYRISSNSLHETVRRELLVIAESKAGELELLARERIGDITSLARVPSVVAAVNRLRNAYRDPGPGSAGYRRIAGEVTPFLTHFAGAYGYPNILLFSPSGDVLLSLEPNLDLGANLLSGPLKQTELAGAFDRAKTLLQAELSDFQQYPKLEEPAAFMASPVLDQGALVGIIALQLNNQPIYSIFRDYTGLGETGETVVGYAIGNQVVVAAPLRHDPRAAFQRQAKLGSEVAVPLQLAVQGHRGYGEDLDYRGSPVMAVWTYVPSFRLGLVVKQDIEEAFSLIDRQRGATILLLVLTAIPVALVALLVAGSLSRPIRRAVRVAEQVAEGDLSAEVKVDAADETGQLLAAIQSMTGHLRSLIGRVQKSSVALTSTATQTAATAKQQEQTVHNLETSSHQAVAAVNQITATGQELLGTMEDVNRVASQTAGTAAEGQDGLAAMQQTMGQLVESTRSISAKLGVIRERADDINMVVTTMTKIADQSNLLSINAAIEAQKAGKAGLGFGVVAREIRRLADQSAVATLDIEQMVEEMQRSVTEGVVEMKKFSGEVEQGVQRIGQLSARLGEIISAVQVLTGRFEQVNEGMRAQTQGADQIREAMVQLNDEANRTALSISDLKQSADQMREALNELRQEVSRFQLGSDAVG